MALYNVDFDCPRCGKVHGVIGGPGSGLEIEHGPDRPSTIARLYEGRELPAALVRLLNDKAWCEQATECVLMDYPAGVHLTPHDDP